MCDALSSGTLEGAEVSKAEHAMLEFASLLTRHAWKNSRANVQQLRDVGWSEEQIGEIVYITALFAMFNRVADAFGLQNPGYHQRAAEGKTMRPADCGGSSPTHGSDN